MNEFTVIANIPLEIGGTQYDAGAEITLESNACAPLLVLGHVRLPTSPAPDPPKRKRGRPRKIHTEHTDTYQTRDLRAEE